MIRKLSILYLLIILSFNGLAQSKIVKIEANKQPLNTVLLQLRNQYDFQFSYSENQLAGYKVTISKTFNSKEEAVRYLLKDLPFHLKITRDVFIIIPDKKKLKNDKGKDLTHFPDRLWRPDPMSHCLSRTS